MMGRRTADQRQLFYQFNLDERVPAGHLVRRIDVFVVRALADLHRGLAVYHGHAGRPSIDPELMIRTLIVGYCYGIRSERRLREYLDALDEAGPPDPVRKGSRRSSPLPIRPRPGRPRPTSGCSSATASTT